MKILFVSYPHVGLTKGGMYIQIVETAKALEEIGVEVVFYDPFENQLEDCDICHVFSVHDAVHGYVQAAADRGIPIVWSTVFNVFAKPMWQLRIQVALANYLPGFYNSWKSLARLTEASSHLIFLNEEEKYRMNSLFPESSNKGIIIPNGINDSFSAGDEAFFRKHIGISASTKYVLNVGIICPRKNQLHLIHTAKGKTWSLVLIGPADDSPYARQCRREADKLNNVYMLNALPYGSRLLNGAFAGADVFCLPSTSEVQPLTLIEAALANCHLIASTQTPVMDCLKESVALVHSKDQKALEGAIEKALSEKTETRSLMLKQPTWGQIGSQIEQLYRQILAS